MCYETVTWAVRLPIPLSVPERLVLIYLSDHRNHHTGQCNPSAVTLAVDTGLSRRQIFRALKFLKGRKLITWARTGHSNWYKFPSDRHPMAAPRPVPLTAPRGKLKGVKS